MPIRQFAQMSLMLFTTSLACADARAQSILIDDFNDGNDDGWFHFDFSRDVAGGPAIYDATTGRYNVRTTGVIPADTFAPALSVFRDSSTPRYSNGKYRATVRAENAGTTNVLFMRFRAQDGPPTGYLFGMYGPDSPTEAGDFFFNVLRDPDIIRHETFNVPGSPVKAGEDWIIEAGAVGDQITMKAWPAGKPEPNRPQLVLTDTTYSTGQFGIAAFRDPGVLPEAWQISGTFDDISFTPVPEPSSSGLLCLAAVSLGILRTRRRLRSRIGLD